MSRGITTEIRFGSMDPREVSMSSIITSGIRLGSMDPNGMNGTNNSENSDSKVRKKNMKLRRLGMEIRNKRHGGDVRKNLVASIIGNLSKVPKLSSNYCIYKVPTVLRNLNEAAYTPKLLSIGPFHRDETKLKPMEEHKWRYLNDFLNRGSRNDIDYYVQKLSSIEERARNCYGERINLLSDDFVEMMLLDGCFIIELILKFSVENLRHADDPIFKTAWMLNALRLDMALLENQLPFFVLEHLFNLIDGPYQRCSTSSILDLIIKFYEHDVMGWKPCAEYKGEVYHLVHLLRKSYVPSEKKILIKGEASMEVIPSATKLQNAGVKFGARINGSFLELLYGKRPVKSFLDLQFIKGVFEIPPIRIDNSSSIIIQNIIAFEQFDHHHNYMSQYVMLMDSLMSTGEDVAILRDKGIINNWLRDDKELALLFNKLSDGAIIDNESFHYASLFEDVNVFHKLPVNKKRKAYYNNRLQVWKAKMKKDYFNTPCTTISFIAAFILLICTIAQTLYTIIWQ